MEKSSWIIKNSYIPASLKKSSYDKDILKILAGRGISTLEEVDKFLNPSLENLSSPFDFSDVDKAADKIKSAIDNNTKVSYVPDFSDIPEKSACIAVPVAGGGSGGFLALETSTAGL